MKKTLLKTLLLLCALMAGSSAWAEDFTLSSADEVTQNGITVSFAKGSGSTAPTWYPAGLRLYASNTITISSTNTITGITFDWEKQGSKAFASATASVGTYNHPTSAGEGTWTGSANEVVFTIGSSGQLQLNTFSVTVSSGSNTPICATPTFTPKAGAVVSGTTVTITSATEGATIYYTIDGTDPSLSSSVYLKPIEITAATTIKAFASKSNYNDSGVATAAYTIKQAVKGYTIDFESDVDDYVDWTFFNIGNTNTAITANGGSKYGANINDSGNGVETAYIQTKGTVANPGDFTCYVSKTSPNTSTSTWKVSVSADGSSWTEVATQDATSMTNGDWVKFSADLSTYSNVYVRISYSGSTAIRAIDDITLTERDPNAKEVKYYLVGSFDADPWIDHKVEMTRSGNTYSVSMNLTNGTLFKILKIDETNNDETTWFGGSANGDYYGVNSNVCTDIALSSTGANFMIDGICDETFTFTVDVSNADAPTLTVTGWHVPLVKYYLAGNWSENWSDGKVELTENANGTFSTSKLVGNGTRFKFVKTVDGAESWYGATRSGDDWGVNSAACTGIALGDANDAAAFQIQIAADATLSFTLNPTGMTFDVAGWPITADGNLFQKVTTSEKFTDGAYLIVCENYRKAFNGSLETLDANNNTIDVTIINNAIAANATTKASLFFIQGGTIKSASGFYIGNTANSNGLSASDETAYTNTISIDGNGNAVIISSGGAYLRFNSATTNNRFRYYKSSSYTAQQAIQLYKLVTIENVSVTVTAAEYATICKPVALDFSKTGIKAYTATDNTTSVKLTEIESGQVPANTPVVLYKAGGTTVDVPVIAEAAAITADNDLRLSIGEIPTNAYVLAKPDGHDVGFYLWDSTETLKAGKVYLQATTPSARQFLGFDEATAISDALMEKDTVKDAAVYDLQGRRVAQPAKGLYIIDGRKIIVR